MVLLQKTLTLSVMRDFIPNKSFLDVITLASVVEAQA